MKQTLESQILEFLRSNAEWFHTINATYRATTGNQRDVAIALEGLVEAGRVTYRMADRQVATYQAS